MVTFAKSRLIKLARQTSDLFSILTEGMQKASTTIRKAQKKNNNNKQTVTSSLERIHNRDFCLLLKHFFFRKSVKWDQHNTRMCEFGQECWIPMIAGI